MRAAQRVLMGAAIAVLALIAAIGIGGIAALRLTGNLQSSPLNLSDGAEAVDDGPLDILVMGSDTRSGTGNSEYGSKDDSEGRTDVMMLLHVTQSRDAVTVVSFPRDLMVEIPQCTDPDSGKVYAAETDMLNSAVSAADPAAPWRPSTSSRASTSTTSCSRTSTP